METTTSSGDVGTAATGTQPSVVEQTPPQTADRVDAPPVGSAADPGDRDPGDRDPGDRDPGDPGADPAPVDPEREGDVAADYLEELLDIADLDGDIDLDVEGDRAVVSLVGGDLDVLVGPQGSVLEALQDLTRLAVLRGTGRRSRLLLDVDGWRSRRRDQIRLRATEAVRTAKETGEPVALPPMSAYERKVVHDAVAELGLVSSSDGEDPNRHVVVRTA